MDLAIKNNVCVLIKGDSTQLEYDQFRIRCLQKRESVRRAYKSKGKLKFSYVEQTVRFYDEMNGHYVFPRGIYEIMSQADKDCLEITDLSTNDFPVTPNDLGELSEILKPDAPFSLRNDQIVSMRKALLLKRGIIQLPTGSGKSEIMSGIIRKLEKLYHDIRVLVIEPTDVLVDKTTDRFNKYNLNARKYHDIRNDDESEWNVLVSHTNALLNDCEEDAELLSGINAVFWDECQHCKCDTWKKLNRYLSNVEYAIGLSALAVNEERIYESNLAKLTTDEIMVMGSTGKVIISVSPKSYIDKGILATPVVIQLLNPVDPKISAADGNNWAKLRTDVIESEYRDYLTSSMAAFLSGFDRKVLILVGTKKQAENIAIATAKKCDCSVCISFGGGLSYHVNVEDEELLPYSGDIVNDFDNGKFKILISTSHMDEGIDLKNLDAAILASGGKKDRRIIQRIGRALRVNKTGKYAYIIDFLDNDRGILESHSRKRMSLYSDVVGISDELIFRKYTLHDAFDKFAELENV